MWYSRSFVFFFKQKTAYEMRISDWSSDVCSSDLRDARPNRPQRACRESTHRPCLRPVHADKPRQVQAVRRPHRCRADRSEEHTSELQSLMRISYAVFCLKKKKQLQQIG